MCSGFGSMNPLEGKRESHEQSGKTVMEVKEPDARVLDDSGGQWGVGFCVLSFVSMSMEKGKGGYVDENGYE